MVGGGRPVRSRRVSGATLSAVRAV